MTPDHALVASQLRELALLDDAHRASARVGWITGAIFFALGLAFPLMKVAGMIAAEATSSPFVHRMANLPIWVVGLMIVCGGGLGLAGFVFGWRVRNQGSSVLDHLRAHPDDPIAQTQCDVVVRNGHRIAHFHFWTRRGTQLYQNVDAGFEPKVLAAIDRAVPAPTASPSP